MREHDVGDLVKVTGIWTDPDNAGAAVDPTAIRLKVQDPSGNIEKIAYDGDNLDDSEEDRIWRSAAGIYHYNIDVDEEGVWQYRWYSTGTGQASAVEYFRAKATVGTGT